jgi:predicted porin
MKHSVRSLLPVALVSSLSVLGTCAAHAESSNVTIYGIIDSGVNWTNNVAGKSTTNVDTGVNQGNRIGFKGTEDLGGGLKTVWVLESGFSEDTGALGQGGLMFGRQASVGLSSTTWGTLTMGRMFDVMGDMFPYYAIGSMTPAGLMSWSLPMNSAAGAALDNRVSGSAINNTVRYYSPNFGPISFGGTYSFGEVAGASTGTNGIYSAEVTYAQGPLRASLGTYFKHNASTTNGNIREYAAGAQYKLDSMTFFGMISDVSYSMGTKDRATTGEIGMTYFVLPALQLGGGIQAQRRHDLASADQLTFTADYLLSKRSDLYMVISNGRDRQYGAQVEAALGGVSDSTAQTGVRFGFKHKF